MRILVLNTFRTCSPTLLFYSAKILFWWKCTVTTSAIGLRKLETNPRSLPRSLILSFIHILFDYNITHFSYSPDKNYNVCWCKENLFEIWILFINHSTQFVLLTVALEHNIQTDYSNTTLFRTDIWGLGKLH